MVGKALGVLRDAAAFGVFFAGVALEAAGRRMSDEVERFVEDSNDLRAVDERRDEPSVPFAPVKLSPVAFEMLAEGRQPSRTIDEPRTGPLVGSVRERFARRA